MLRFAGRLVSILWFGAMLCPLPGIAWGQGPDISPMAPTAVSQGLLVHGHAEVKALPDIAYVTCSVVTQSKQSAWASRDNAQKSQAVVAALKAAGIADKDIQTQGYDLEPQYSYDHNTQVLTGYQATNTIRATVRNLTKVGAVIDAAVKAGANNVGGITFDLSDRHHVEGEALVAAIANARSKADLMAGAAGVSLGSIMRISEDNAPIVQPIFVMARMAAPGAIVAGPETPVSTQEITVTADVTVVYALVPR